MLKEIAIKYSIEAVENAVKALRFTSKFFPHPADVNETLLEQKAAEDASESASARRVAATHGMLETRFPPGEYVTMEEIYQDYQAHIKAKADAKAKAAGE